jgi:hypothetical protein
MAEQTFKSPGFFEREIEVISRPIFRNTATPVGLIGPAERGPAFVPTTVSSVDEFNRIFGAPDKRMLSGHAATEFFRNNGKALTFCRTLGTGYYSGGNQNAGFKLTATEQNTGTRTDPLLGAVHFITAEHKVADAEFLGLGMFNDNDSHTTNLDLAGGAQGDDLSGLGNAGQLEQKVQLVRAMIFTHKDITITVGASGATADYVAVGASPTFTIRFLDNTLTELDSLPAKTVSLDPSSPDYISKVLNTDPLSFDDEKYLLYAHFAVDTAVANVENTYKVAVLHGNSGVTINGAASDMAVKYGDFGSRFTAPLTPKFISQPFGDKEYDLFHFESLDDGAYASSKYKISISNLRASTDPTDEFGTFNVTVRDLKDTDETPIVYESYTNCSLNSSSLNFIGRIIGDQKLYYDFETAESERRLIREGSFANKSTRLRVVLSDDVLSGEVPHKALPFGFRGTPALLLNSAGTDNTSITPFTTNRQNTGVDLADLDHSVMPPLPYRFKVTKGSIRTGSAYKQTFTGEASTSETVDFNLHWGLMPTRIKDINNANSSTEFNSLLLNYTKFLGNDSDVVKTGLIADSHNNNKFSLAKVALKTPLAGANPDLRVDAIVGTISDIFKNAVYVRNADVGSNKYDSQKHLIDMSNSEDPLSLEQAAAVQDLRMSLAKILAEDSVAFNKYSVFAKFTAPFYGGFDGLNILDSDSYYMTDRGTSVEAGGKASKDGFDSGIKLTSLAETLDENTTSELMQGYEIQNNLLSSLRNAVRVMTDDLVVNHNVMLLPNIRDPFTTDFVKRRIEDYGKALYLMDIPQFDKDNNRVFVNEKGISSGRSNVEKTSRVFDSREVDSNYVAVYYPDVKILDFSDAEEAAIASRRMIKVPPSVVALGALAKTDAISQPWFAPAGFSRGSLETIQAIDVRLNAGDRDTLYEARINPIANFPNKQFVIFGQKTTQLQRSSLDRVNVRRLVLEVKRRIELIAQGLLFEQNNKSTRDRFIQSSSSQLAFIQLGQGIEDFRVVMDDTNNTSEDVDNNRLNGRIIIVPTRAIEFIAIDFVITNAGVEFP